MGSAHYVLWASLVRYIINRTTALVVCMGLLTSIAYADIAARMDVAGRQAMLSMRMAMSLCLVQAGANENYQYAAQQAIQVFDKSLHALLHGEAYGISAPERHRPVLTAINRVTEMWFQLGPDYWDMSVNQASSEIISEMIDENILLMQVSDAVAFEVSAVYAQKHAAPGTLPLLVELNAARTLSQKAVKEACFATQGFRADEMLASLGISLQQMDAKLADLAQAAVANTMSMNKKAAIAQSIEEMSGIWAVLRSELQRIHETGAASKAQLDTLGRNASQFLGVADMVTQHYAPILVKDE